MKTRILRLAAGTLSESDDVVAVEEPLDILINGHPFSLTMRTPGNDEELVTGLLFAEGVISGASDILGMSRQSPNHLDISIAPNFTPARHARQLISNSACGICGDRAIASRIVIPAIPPSDFSIGAAALHALPDALAAGQKFFQETGGLHAAALFDSNGTILLSREDVGRHNAVDKVVGAAVRDRKTPLSDVGLLVSGRIAFEIVQKAARAGVPFLVAIGAPTSLAVETAEAAGISLAGFLRADRVNVYTGILRVSGSPPDYSSSQNTSNPAG